MTVEAKFAIGPIYVGTTTPDEIGCLWVDENSTPNPVKVQVDISTFVTIGYEDATPLKDSGGTLITAGATSDGGFFKRSGTTYVTVAPSNGWGDPSGTTSKAAFATYESQTISDPPTQTEVQAINDALVIASQHVAAIQAALKTMTIFV